jgi:transcriptional regulator with XRE-family HTH domain
MTSELRRFAVKIRKIRQQQGLSQQTVADRASISREYLARLENGEHDPTLSVVRRLARALKVPIAKLLT